MSLEPKRKPEGEILQPFLVRTVLEHIIGVILGKYPPAAVAYPYKTSIAYFSKVVAVIDLLLTMFLAYLFYTSVEQQTSIGPYHKVHPVAFFIFFCAELK